MNITINAKNGSYIIESDDRQYILSEEKTVKETTKTRKKGDRYKTTIGYIPSFENLLNRLIDLEIKRSDVRTLKELKDEYNSTSRFIKRLLQGEK